MGTYLVLWLLESHINTDDYSSQYRKMETFRKEKDRRTRPYRSDPSR